MNEYPIIVKIESQQCLRHEHHGAQTVSVIENTGVDRAGVRWRWLTNNWSEPQISAKGDITYLMFSGHGYAYMRLESQS